MLRLERIHEYKGEEIYLIGGDLKEHEEITLFITKKDFARGGCVHKQNDEFCIVLEGTIQYFIGNKIELLQKGQSIEILYNTPHYFKSLTDSIVLEWGANPEEKKEKHESFRKK